MVGAVRGIDRETGHYFDDTRRYVDAAAVSDNGSGEDFSRATRGGSFSRLSA